MVTSNEYNMNATILYRGNRLVVFPISPAAEFFSAPEISMIRLIT